MRQPGTFSRHQFVHASRHPLKDMTGLSFHGQSSRAQPIFGIFAGAVGRIARAGCPGSDSSGAGRVQMNERASLALAYLAYCTKNVAFERSRDPAL